MTQIGSISWPGPVGIAAGLIKGTAAFLDFAKQASSLEIGSITLDPLKGNDGKTIWRYPEHRGLRHHAGMPNPGSIEIVHQLLAVQDQITIPWGINIATSPGISDTQLAVANITSCAQNILTGGLKPHWLTLNVSSPDTDDSIALLSEPARVLTLIQALKPLTQQHQIPFWIKLGATMPQSFFVPIGHTLLSESIDAIICSNAVPDTRGEVGGWCGAPISQVSQHGLQKLLSVTNHQIPVISVGGILTGQDVADRIQAGATAVQIASALLLRGRDAAQAIQVEHQQL